MDLISLNPHIIISGLGAITAAHPHLVEGLPTPSPAPPPSNRHKAGNDPLRLCEANLAQLAVERERGRGTSVRGGGGSISKAGAMATASVASAAGSVLRGGGHGHGHGHGQRECARAAAPSVTTAGTRLSVAETVIARAQARKGMF